MSKGSWTASEADSAIVAADTYRASVTVQVLSGGPIYLGFGEAAVAGEGLYVTEGGSITIDDHRARLAIHAICGAGSTAAGGYQTA